MQSGGPCSVFTDRSLCLKRRHDRYGGVVGRFGVNAARSRRVFTFHSCRRIVIKCRCLGHKKQSPLNPPPPPKSQPHNCTTASHLVFARLPSVTAFGLTANKALWHARASATSKQLDAAISLQSLGGNYECIARAMGLLHFNSSNCIDGP